MKERVLTVLAIVLVVASVLLTKIIVGTSIVFDVLVILLAVAAGFEMSKILKNQGKHNNKILIMAFPVLLFAMLYALMTLHMSILVIGFSVIGLVVLFLLVGFLWAQVASASTENEMREGKIRTSKSAFAITKALNTIGGCLYPTFLIMLFMPINHIADFGYLFGGETSQLETLSIIMLGLCFAIPFICDTFAYLIGKAVGGKKLCPKISPKKTISGAIGGVLSTVLLVCVLYLILSSIPSLQLALEAFGLNWWLVAIVAFVGGIICTIGDLFESFLKRKANMKDSGDILPGHGGILDRLDGMIFVVPCVLVFTILLILL